MTPPTHTYSLDLMNWVWATHRTQRNILLATLLIYYNNITLEEMHRTRSEERDTQLPCPPQPRSTLNLILLKFYRSFITYVWLIRSQAPGNHSTSISPPPGGRGEGQRTGSFNQPFNHKVGSPGNNHSAQSNLSICHSQQFQNTLGKNVF